jgi:hypothetical protein
MFSVPFYHTPSIFVFVTHINHIQYAVTTEYRFCIHMSVHRNIITNYSQQDTTFLEFISTDALYVSSGSSAHHQEHITVVKMELIKFHLLHGSS